MDTYQPPVTAMLRALEVAGLNDITNLPAFSSLDRDDVADVLDGFGRFAADVLAPTDRIGDRQGNDFNPASGEVVTPREIRSAFERWVADGWPGLAVPAQHGGGGLPGVVGVAAEEMFASANLALSLNPMLTQGSVHLLSEWGSEEQQRTYLPKLVSSEWTGTMNLTEPDAGSDVGAVRTRATPRDDGRWEITGTKIFITWGEHDLADNIVHLVLARTPNAPAGTKGISLFVVPRQLLGPDGISGERNRVRCTGLEDKLGIHASPTCMLEFDAAVGDLVGPECGGMAAMFTMMNAARLSVGVEGLAVAERAYQQAKTYATERRQGRGPHAPSGETSPIIHHPDVRRMLLSMASNIDAMRLLIYSTAAAADIARHHPDPERRRAASVRADLLTPLAKAWCTDEGVRLSSLAVQVHGGAGYVEETGIAQRYRDSRIAPIYEGTNGIQAIDLVARKVRRDHGRAMTKLIDELHHEIGGVPHSTEMSRPAELASQALQALREGTDWMVAASDEEDWLAGATPYLELASLAVCGGLYARAVTHPTARCSREGIDASTGLFRFFAAERLAPAPGLLEQITSGGAVLSLSHLR